MLEPLPRFLIGHESAKSWAVLWEGDLLAWAITVVDGCRKYSRKRVTNAVDVMAAESGDLKRYLGSGTKLYARPRICCSRETASGTRYSCFSGSIVGYHAARVDDVRGLSDGSEKGNEGACLAPVSHKVASANGQE